MEKQREIISPEEAYHRYKDFLDKKFGKVEIAGEEYFTSFVLPRVDLIAFTRGKKEWADTVAKVEIARFTPVNSK